MSSPRWVGHSQSVDWNKRLTLPWGRENSSCLTEVELGHHLFPCLWTWVETSVLGTGPAGLWMGTAPSAPLGPRPLDLDDAVI